jgi:hypothetical protein
MPNKIGLLFTRATNRLMQPSFLNKYIFIVGFKNSTINISNFLDDILQTLFDNMAREATIASHS